MSTTVSPAIEELAGALGADAVLTSDEDLREFRDPFQFASWDEYTASAVLMPTTVEEIQAIVRIANDDAVCCRIKIDNVPRARRTAGQPFALSDREQLEPVMFTEEISIDIVNLAAVKFVFTDMRTQKRLVIVAGNKTNFLAIDLVGNFKA